MVYPSAVKWKPEMKKQVFDWLEKEKHNNTLPAFEMGFGTNNFSTIKESTYEKIVVLFWVGAILYLFLIQIQYLPKAIHDI